MTVGTLVIVWSIGFIDRRDDSRVFLLLGALLFLVGGCVAQVAFIALGWAVSRRIGRPLTWWRSILPRGADRRLAIAGVVPGVTGPARARLICWSAPGLMLAMLLLAIVAGSANDAEGQAEQPAGRLADALGIEAMSLYHHVPNKGALLEWTVERMRSEMRLPDPLQSLAPFTVGFSILRAPSARVDAPQTTRDLAERSREWRDETCRRGLRMIMEGYRPRRHSDRGDRATDSGRRS